VGLFFWRPVNRSAALHRAAVAALPFILILHLQHLRSMAAQRAATDQQFAGLTSTQRQQQLADFALHELALRVQQTIDDPQRRVFVFAGTPFVRHRLHWHLQPQRAAVYGRAPKAEILQQLAPPDCVLVHDDAALFHEVIDGHWAQIGDSFQAKVEFRAGASGLICLEPQK